MLPYRRAVHHAIGIFGKYLHLEGAVRLSEDLGWPHRHSDWELTTSLSEGFALVRGGDVVGTALATLFGPDVAALNMIIIDAALRGRGLGQQLMHAILDLSGTREQRLIATQSGLPLYERMGFVTTGQILQLQGKLTAVSDSATADWLDMSERNAIVALDVEASGMQRADLIDRLIEVGQIAVLRDNGSVTAYAALRNFGHGEVVGPVVASSDVDARSLLSFLFSRRTGAFMRIDCDATAGLADWLERLGLVCVDRGTAMVRQPATRTRTTNVSTYALASQALT